MNNEKREGKGFKAFNWFHCHVPCECILQSSRKYLMDGIMSTKGLANRQELTVEYLFQGQRDEYQRSCLALPQKKWRQSDEDTFKHSHLVLLASNSLIY